MTTEWARLIAEDWRESVEENTQQDIEAALAEFGRQMAVHFEVYFDGDDARLSLAQVFRETADEIEASTGRLIVNGRNLKKRLEAGTPE